MPFKRRNIFVDSGVGALGEEFRDLDDVRYLLRYLNVSILEEAPPSSCATSMRSTSLPRRAWRSRSYCADRDHGPTAGAGAADDARAATDDAKALEIADPPTLPHESSPRSALFFVT